MNSCLLSDFVINNGFFCFDLLICKPAAFVLCRINVSGMYCEYMNLVAERKLLFDVYFFICS